MGSYVIMKETLKLDKGKIVNGSRSIGLYITDEYRDAFYEAHSRLYKSTL